MDVETIREVVRTYLSDFGIEPTNRHYSIAINYYNVNQVMPPVDYLIAAAFEDVVGLPEERQSPHSSADDDEQDREEEQDEQQNNDQVNDGQIDSESSSSDDAVQVENNIIPNSQTFAPLITIFGSLHSGTLIGSIVNRFLGEVSNSNIQDVKKVLSKEELAKLPLVLIDNTNKATYNQCSICFDELVETDLVRILPCKHFYHRRCIDKQLKNESYLCPLCKGPCGEGTFINT